MTRDDALLKLLQVEPVTKQELFVVTGWPLDETRQVLDRLIDQGKVTWINGNNGGAGGQRWYRPA